jgi:hypothetical protein
MLLWGERPRSSRGDNVPPGSPGEPDTGRWGLDIRADRKSHEQQYAVVTSLKSRGRENEET